MNGGDRIADVLVAQGVTTLFTLCGGHISPILVSAKSRGIRVVDVRDEKNAVFAADATARLTGTVGVAAVTAGPGVTNTITAIKNAQLAQSPLVLLGGATATVLRDRGALQDIDQLALFAPHVKWAVSVGRVRDLAPTLERAFARARAGVPGPVFVEVPVDLLYDEPTVRDMYGAKATSEITSPVDLAVQAYLRFHLARVFAKDRPRPRLTDQPTDRRTLPAGSEPAGSEPAGSEPTDQDLDRAVDLLATAVRPVFVLGSQVVRDPAAASDLRGALERLGVPVYLSGMARGLLGRSHPLWVRHRRGEALKRADVVFLVGVPADFRLAYGRGFARRAKIVTINLSARQARLNLRPVLTVVADPATVLTRLAPRVPATMSTRLAEHLAVLRTRDDERAQAIAADAEAPSTAVNPVLACQLIERAIGPDSVVVVDGGDFVATASYVVAPRGPLSWLDPGVFGTLGVGAGFAMAAQVARPDAEVWVLYGDGSVGFTISEFDSFVRHGLPVIAVVGNDAGWTQIARDQVPLLGDDVGTVLARTDYDRVAEGFGARGLVARTPEELAQALDQAKALARAGQPVLVNVHLGSSEFRKGSVSM